MSDPYISGLKGKVDHALIRLYFKQVLALKIGNTLVALLMAYALWNDQNTLSLIIWLSLHLLTSASELWMRNIFSHHRHQFSNTGWLLLLIPPTLASGLLWGAAATLFLDISNPINVITMTILLLGMLSGSLYTLSLLPPLFHIFAAMFFLQYILSLSPEPALLIIMFAALGLGCFFAILSYQLFRITRDLLLSRYKNKTYARELRQEKRISEQANAAKSHFLASANHDLRQPLQAMGLYAESLRYRLNDPHNIKNLQALMQSHASMNRMMEPLLDISKLDATLIKPTLNTLSLQPLLHHLLKSHRMIAEKKGILLRSRIANLKVYSDTGLLERILGNLISNAVRYTECGSVLIACRRQKEMVIVDVWDTGKGIPANKLEEIFLEFYQLDNPERDQQKGMGLGLAIVQRLTGLLPNHHIDVCSRPGQGSRFRLTMPIVTDTSTAERSVGNYPAHGGISDHLQGQQVLLIEDDQAVAKSMIELMQTWGCHVTTFNNAAEAIIQVEQGWVPGAVIADYRLPGKQTGVQAIQTIRNLLHQPVVALIVTGESQPEVLQDIQSNQISFLHKPSPPAQLRLFLTQAYRSDSKLSLTT